MPGHQIEAGRHGGIFPPGMNGKYKEGEIPPPHAHPQWLDGERGDGGGGFLEEV